MAAAIPANAAPALPVEAVTTISALISLARATTIALARSLKEAVGFFPSSLIHRSGNPNDFLRIGGEYSGVHPESLNGVLKPPGSFSGKRGRYSKVNPLNVKASLPHGISPGSSHNQARHPGSRHILGMYKQLIMVQSRFGRGSNDTL
jgi:hypothetical protein